MSYLFVLMIFIDAIRFACVASFINSSIGVFKDGVAVTANANLVVNVVKVEGVEGGSGKYLYEPSIKIHKGVKKGEEILYEYDLP